MSSNARSNSQAMAKDSTGQGQLLIFEPVSRPHREPMAHPHMVPAAPPPDAALIRAWQGGDEQAAAELVGRHARPLARFLAGARAPRAGAGDLVAEAIDPPVCRG